MKILAFVDWHSDFSAWKKISDKVKKSNPDLIVCAGDISIFEQHIEYLMKMLDSLNIPVFIIHGNHEEPKILEKLCERSSNVVFIHKKIVEFRNVLFVGYGGGGFSQEDENFERFADYIKDELKNRKFVFVSHAPFYGTKTDFVWNRHVGSKSFARFIKLNKNIVLGICGHLHECSKKRDKLGNAVIINPGPDGEIIEI